MSAVFFGAKLLYLLKKLGDPCTFWWNFYEYPWLCVCVISVQLSAEISNWICYTLPCSWASPLHCSPFRSSLLLAIVDCCPAEPTVVRNKPSIANGAGTIPRKLPVSNRKKKKTTFADIGLQENSAFWFYCQLETLFLLHNFSFL